MRTKFLALFALSFLPFAASASWVNIGPPGGEAPSMASIPSLDTLFAVNPRSGVFRSVGGRPWTLVFDAVARGVTAGVVVVDPQSLRLYAGTSGGLFRSEDEGVSWELVLNEKIVDVTATYDRLMVATPDQLLRSATAGEAWTVISPPGNTKAVTLVRFDPRNEQNVIAAADGMFFRSEDFGASWVLLTPANVNGAYFGDSLYVAGDGVYACGTDCTRVSTDTAIDVTQWQNELYEATTDGIFHLVFQQHRFALIEGFPDATPLTVQSTPSALFAGTTAGIVSTSDGARWTNASTGFNNVRITAVIKTAQSTFAATQGQGVLRERGGSWTPAYVGLLGTPPNAPVTRSLAWDGTTLYAAFPDNGLFRSVNDGESWEDVSAGLPIKYTLDVAADGGVAIAATISGVVRSTDHGGTWQRLAGFPAFSAATVALRGSTIAAGSAATAIISTDSGATWQSNDLPAFIRHVAIAGTRIYALTDQGLFVRDQNAWSGPLFGGAAVKAMAADGSRLYVSRAGGIDYSDNATNWLHVGDSETLPSDVTALFVRDATVYVGTNGGSIFSSPVAPRRRAARP